MIYYFVFFKPERERAEIRLQEQKLEIEKEKQKADEVRIEQDKRDKEQEELDKKTYMAKELENLNKWYNVALEEARKNYHEDWNINCKNLGLTDGSPLPNNTADTFNKYYDDARKRIDESYQSQKDDIYKLFE